MLPVTDVDRIRRIRIASRSPDALAVRRATEQALGNRTLGPPGLSPQAIVCVRHLRLSTPRDGPAWGRALDRELERVVAGAVRPFRAAVPADAAVVVFADRAELLACLARDWQRGDRGAWWWQSLFEATLAEDLLVSTFIESVTAAPAALERIALTGSGPEILTALSTASCTKLVTAIARAFAVPSLPDSIVPSSAAPDDARAESTVRAVSPRQIARVRAALDIPGAVAMTALAAPHRGLLAVALLLRRDAAMARAPEVVRHLGDHAWVHAASAAPADHRSLAVREVEESNGAARAIPSVDGTHSEASAGIVAPVSLPPIVSAPVIPVIDGVAAASESPDEFARERPSDVPASSLAAIGRVAEPLDAPRRETPGDVLCVDSEFAGVVYLVNVALHVELYGDFTQPARRGLDLPLGGFLALAGERVCGAAFAGDPLWAVLAQWEGRAPDDPPGCDVDPPPGHTMAGWIDQLVETLAAAAAPALGLPHDDVLAFVCARPGRVALSPARLDVTFALAHHPLAIRIAGIDRNPGWVPAGGRVIEFHYE